MRVLFDARTVSAHYPGVGRYGAGLLSALAAKHGSELVVLRGPGEKLPGLDGVQQVALTSSVRSLRDQLSAPQFLSQQFPAHNAVYHSPFYVYPYRLGLPKIVTLYDLTPLIHPQGFSVALRLIYRAAHRLAVQHARCIITLAEAARQDLASRLGVAAERIVVVPPGMTREPVAAASIEVPPDYLFYVGINKPHKNLVRLVEAYHLLGPTAPPLLIAGPIDPRFPETQAAVERAGLQGQVTFLGRVSESELTRLYTHATLFVFPTLAEGFGFPVLEAMGYGAPVACSDIAVLRELAGEAAVYFDPHSPQAMAAVLHDALAHPAQLDQLRELGFSRAAAYTWERAAAQTWQVYEDARQR